MTLNDLIAELLRIRDQSGGSNPHVGIEYEDGVLEISQLSYNDFLNSVHILAEGWDL